MNISPSAESLDLSHGEDTPWPLREVLSTLIEATEHLLNAHSCDAHGHERFAKACYVAKQLLANREAKTHEMGDSLGRS